MRKYVLSIIVPIYNAESQLKKCIDSIVNENPDDVQVILVDDGSIDNSLSICNEYKKKHRFLTVLHKENTGVSATRNFGMNYATGEYILFLDADDWLEKNWYFELRECIKNRHDDMLVFPYRVCYTNDNSNYTVSPFEVGNITIQKFYECLASTTYMNFCWGKLIRKDFLDVNNIRFQEGKKIGEDVQFQIEILKYQPQIFFCSVILINYYQFPASVMHRFSISKFSYLEEDYYCRKELLEISGKSTDAEKKMYNILGRILLSYIIRLCQIEPQKTGLKVLFEIEKKEYFNAITKNARFSGKHWYKSLLFYLVRKRYWSIIYFMFGGRTNV